MLDGAGRVDRAQIAAIVFARPRAAPRARGAHPPARRARSAPACSRRPERRGAAVAVAEASQLLEARTESDYDRVLLVVAPEAERLRRWEEKGGDVGGRAPAHGLADPAHRRPSTAPQDVLVNDGSIEDSAAQGRRRSTAAWTGGPGSAAMLLRSRTPAAWAAAVLADFDAFLLDHAACERKASATAMSLDRALPRPHRARARVPRRRARGARALRAGLEAARRARASSWGPTEEPLHGRSLARVPQGKRRLFPRPAARHGTGRGARLRALRPRRRGAARRRPQGLLPRPRALRGPASGALRRARAKVLSAATPSPRGSRSSSPSRRASSRSSRFGRRCTDPRPASGTLRAA